MNDDLLSQLLNDEEQSCADEADPCDRAPVARLKIAYLVKTFQLVERKEIDFGGGQKKIYGQHSDSVEKIDLEILLSLVQSDSEEVGDRSDDDDAEPHHL